MSGASPSGLTYRCAGSRIRTGASSTIHVVRRARPSSTRSGVRGAGAPRAPAGPASMTATSSSVRGSPSLGATASRIACGARASGALNPNAAWVSRARSGTSSVYESTTPTATLAPSSVVAVAGRTRARERGGDTVAPAPPRERAISSRQPRVRDRPGGQGVPVLRLGPQLEGLHARQGRPHRRRRSSHSSSRVAGSLGTRRRDGQRGPPSTTSPRIGRLPCGATSAERARGPESAPPSGTTAAALPASGPRHGPRTRRGAGSPRRAGRSRRGRHAPPPTAACVGAGGVRGHAPPAPTPVGVESVARRVTPAPARRRAGGRSCHRGAARPARGGRAPRRRRPAYIGRDVAPRRRRGPARSAG